MDNRALGKGLSALIPEKEQVETVKNVSNLKTDLIYENSLQPRNDYNPEKLEELKNSIKEKGILQPLLVREKDGRYEVVAGERRLRAARMLGLEEVPVIIKTLTDKDTLVIALIENIQREELNPIEEAEAFRKLIEEFQYTQEAVAQSVGKNRTTITNLLRILNLPPHIQKSVSKGEISVGHARALLAAPSPVDQERLFISILENNLTVRDIEGLTQKSPSESSRKTKPSKDKSPDILALENELQTALGTKVNVLAKKKKGKIVIEYYSLDDLDRILKKIR